MTTDDINQMNLKERKTFKDSDDNTRMKFKAEKRALLIIHKEMTVKRN